MQTGAPSVPFADLALSRRLERAEGRSNAEAVAARARLWPERGARCLEVGGVHAMFDGLDSPLTQTFGLGVFDPVTVREMEALESFFTERGAPTCHEVSPLAGAATLALLNERAYKPIEFTSVMFRPVERGPIVQLPADLAVTVRVAGPEEEDVWGRTAAEGWAEVPEVQSFLREVGRLMMASAGATCFVAEAGGTPVATGMMSIHDGVALLAGASTIPSARRQGAQLALLDARLRFAAEKGCDLAMMGAAPGSPSQRNAERHGFRIAYTRVKWRKG